MNTNPIIHEPFSFEKQTFKCVSYNETEFIMDWTMESGGTVPTHTHEFSDEFFFITKGSVKFTVDGETIYKKAGEELLIKKNIPHSITNDTKEEIAVNVKYSPCADIHRMFTIMATLNKSNPGSSVNIMKYFYLVSRLRLKSFSTPQPKFVFWILTLIVTIAGKLSGWDKLIDKFR
jgi:quercetin dioxygenase-like cupin family protein